MPYSVRYIHKDANGYRVSRHTRSYPSVKRAQRAMVKFVDKHQRSASFVIVTPVYAEVVDVHQHYYEAVLQG